MILFPNSSHDGATAKGQHFDEFLGKTYETQFLPLFNEFLETLFSDILYPFNNM